MVKPDILESHSVILLECRGRYLLLKRSPHKRFAPNQWTGIGGRVENDEFGRLTYSALRELKEETGIDEDQVQGFTLRRVILVARPADNINLLLYFTGCLDQPVLPDCPEGTLAWMKLEEMIGLEIIETSRPVLPLLAEDLLKDPHAGQSIKVGVAVFNSSGTFSGIQWVSG